MLPGWSLMQVGLHEQYGGVKPDVAQAAHAAAIQDTVQGAIAAAGVTADQLSAVAVTVGPGLSLCLQVCRVLVNMGRNVVLHHACNCSLM